MVNNGYYGVPVLDHEVCKVAYRHVNVMKCLFTLIHVMLWE